MSFILESQCKFAEFSKAAQELSSKVLGQLSKLVLDVPNNKELFSDSTHFLEINHSANLLLVINARHRFCITKSTKVNLVIDWICHLDYFI